MLEFDSISVSSYEADSLAPQLTERSAAGWQVVSIVSAGSSVTAFLSREAEATAATDAVESPAESGAPAESTVTESFGGEETGPIEDVAVEPETTIAEPVVAAPVVEPVLGGPVADESPTIDGLSAETPQVSDVPVAPEERFAPGAVDVPAIDEPAVDTPNLAAEPASSWQPETTSAAQPSLADDVAALASQIESEQAAPGEESSGWAASGTTQAAEATPSFEPTLPGSGAAAEPAAQPAAQQSAEPAQQATETAQQAAAETAGASAAAASAATAPAGWYADPSTRFELRYWDGTQWTEHVSRAGQQYTDPPVA